MSRRRPYERTMDGWWRRNPHYLRYMLREGTSVLLAAYCGVVLWGLLALASGPDAWTGWLAAMRHPPALAFHLVVLAAACHHSVTWFAVAPKTLPPLSLGGKPITVRTLVAAQYAGAGVVSSIILASAWGGGP